MVRFYIPLMSAPLGVDGTANKRPLPVEDLGLCKHYLLIALICEFFHLI